MEYARSPAVPGGGGGAPTPAQVFRPMSWWYPPALLKSAALPQRCITSKRSVRT